MKKAGMFEIKAFTAFIQLVGHYFNIFKKNHIHIIGDFIIIYFLQIYDNF